MTTNQTPKHPEKVATTSFPEPSPSNYALVGSPSILPTESLVSIPIYQHSNTDTLSAGIPSATSASPPMEVQKAALLTDSSPSTIMTSHDLYLKGVKEMYPHTNIEWLRSSMAFHEDWASTRAVAALTAFISVKSMISDGKLVYDDRASLSDDDSSKSIVASYMQKKPKKKNLDDKDKKFFTCLTTCYALFFAFDSKDAVKSYCPFAHHDKCWQEKNSLE